MTHQWQTPRTWPEGTKPTQEQMARWLQRASWDDLMAYVERTEDGLTTAELCIREAHEARMHDRHPLWWHPEHGQQTAPDLDGPTDRAVSRVFAALTGDSWRTAALRDVVMAAQGRLSAWWPDRAR